MSYSNPGKIISLIAAADLSSSQYFAIKVDANGKAALGAAGTDDIIGISQNVPTAGQECSVMVDGISDAVYNATVAAGNLLMSDASGKFIPATSTNVAVAVALEAGAAGERHPVLIKSFGKQ